MWVAKNWKKVTILDLATTYNQLIESYYCNIVLSLACLSLSSTLYLNIYSAPNSWELRTLHLVCVCEVISNNTGSHVFTFPFG